MVEKDRLLRQLDVCHEKIQSGRGGLDLPASTTAPQRLAQAPSESQQMQQEEIRVSGPQPETLCFDTIRLEMSHGTFTWRVDFIVNLCARKCTKPCKVQMYILSPN